MSEGMEALGEEHIQHHPKAIPWGRLGTAKEVACLALSWLQKNQILSLGKGS